MPVWELDEAIALSLGYDPGSVTREVVQASHFPKHERRRYEQRQELVKRASEVGHLPPPGMSSMPRVAPCQFLEWAKSNEIDYPVELEQSMNARGGALTDWHHENEKSKAVSARKDDVIAKLQAELNKMEQESEALRKEMTDQDANNRKLTEAERKVVRTIIITMAIKGYDYKLAEERSSVPNRIENEAAELGLKVDDGSVRSWLKKSAKLLPKAVAEEHAKPNSAKK